MAHFNKGGPTEGGFKPKMMVQDMGDYGNALGAVNNGGASHQQFMAADKYDNNNDER